MEASRLAAVQCEHLYTHQRLGCHAHRSARPEKEACIYHWAACAGSACAFMQDMAALVRCPLVEVCRTHPAALHFILHAALLTVLDTCCTKPLLGIQLLAQCCAGVLGWLFSHRVWI